MSSAMILWAYSLAAILFVTLAIDGWRRGEQAALAWAFGLTALWALAVAGLGPRDVAARVTEAGRDLAWLSVALSLSRDRLNHGRRAAFALAACLPVALVAFAVLDASEATPALATARTAIRLFVALAGLLLLFGPARTGASPRLVAAIAMLWGVDLVVFVLGCAIGWSPSLALARGMGAIGAGAAFALAMQPASDRRFRVSRGLQLRAIAGAALLLYTVAVAAATDMAGAWGGEHARVLQTAIVTGAAATLLALASTPWLRAWTRVTVEKNLFAHRYDYRVAWRRFTGTLGRPGEGAPLASRIVQATADLIDAPAGLLLVRTESGMAPAAAWRWDGGEGDAGEALAAHLAATGRVVELDQVRNGSAPPEEVAGVPAWMCEDDQAWALVPLVHLGTLVGAILLAPPPVARPLDWEDFDLLRLAGQQAASYLAEDRAHAALADAERFDEFNRRFAFILHDIKNLVSQLTLVARNAERHADNPEFRADMIATLKDSAERMTALIGRLSHRAPAAEPPAAVDLRPLLDRIAARDRSRHPIEIHVEEPALALADASGLAQALSHLLQNAVEASPAGAPVGLSSRMEGGYALIEVADRGQGMSSAFVRDQLFRPFASSKPGGFGLGAYEARQIVRAMGGALQVESREGEGTLFRIALPAAEILGEAA